MESPYDDLGTLVSASTFNIQSQSWVVLRHDEAPIRVMIMVNMRTFEGNPECRT
jgi:hypothetical protein